MNYRETMSRLNTALHNIDLAYTVIAKKHELTFNALMTVCMIAEKENVTQKQICDALHLPKSTVHSILLDFIKHGYVELTAGDNKKEKRVVFTRAGAGYFARVLKDVERFENSILSAFGDDTCAFLIETAESLGDIITKELAEIEGCEVSV